MIQEQDIQKAFERFSKGLKQPFQLKGIFFDMDGVLYNSMPLHAKSWTQTFAEYDLVLPEIEPYMNEGSTAFFTVRRMFKKYLNKEAGDEVCESIKKRKHEIMGNMPQADILKPMPDLLRKISSQNIECWVVTGSAQERLIGRLVHEFDPALNRKHMITAHDVVQGKPHPEPYLNAMKKSGYNQNSAIVVENAPLGIQSSKAAGLFTIAVNTGPLSTEILAEAGADLIFSSTSELYSVWPVIYRVLKEK